MLEIRRTQVEKLDDTPLRYVTEASEIGLQPGVVPQVIELCFGTSSRTTFYFRSTDRIDGDPYSFEYSTRCGHVHLTVYND